MIKIAPSIGSKGIAILTEKRLSYVDHLVPLCQLTGIPILVTDLWIQHTIEHFYPPMEIIHYDPDDYCLDEALAGYDFFVYTEPSRKATGDFQFLRHYSTLPARSIFTHHGNSEKSFNMYWFERLIDEDVLLVYGDQMIDALREIGIEKPIVQCGNYRLAYYKQHEQFLQERVRPHLFEPSVCKTVLYAPTWAWPNYYTEWRFDYSTCFETSRWVLDHIPEGYQVLVKLHPNYFTVLPDEIEKFIATYQDNPKIRFIHDLPLIYPLLEHVDYYVGDFSSIGYDFLYFNRPMFFLTDERDRKLHRCGIALRENSFWQRICEDQSHLSNMRKKMYDNAFGTDVCTLIS